MPPPDAETLEVVQQLLFQKLKTVFAAVVEAAAMSNNWIIVDRTQSKSPTAEFLLELAIEQAAQRPIVIVIDSEERLGNFSSATAAKQLEQLELLKSRAAPLGSDPSRNPVPLDWLYYPSEFVHPSSFDHVPLPREPEDAHRDPHTGQVYPEMRWWYHYLQCFWASGTHCTMGWDFERPCA